MASRRHSELYGAGLRRAAPCLRGPRAAHSRWTEVAQASAVAESPRAPREVHVDGNLDRSQRFSLEGTPAKVGRVETGRMEHPTPEQTIFRAVTEVAGPCALRAAMAHPLLVGSCLS